MPWKARLTYHKASGQWVKVWKGKKYYLGKGKKTDRKSYLQAWQKWIDISGHLNPSPTNQTPPDAPQASKTRKSQTSYRHPANTLYGQLERYLNHLEMKSKARHTKIQKVYQAKIGIQAYLTFLHIKPTTLLSLPHFTSQKLTGFYKQLTRRITGEHKRLTQISPYTANVYWTNTKAFIYYLYETEHLKDLPRILVSGSLRCFPTKPPQKDTYSVVDIHKLLNACKDTTNGRMMRLFILLALNCGFTQMDLAQLKVSDIAADFDRIIRDRTKTGIPTNHLLWKETKQLLQKHLDETKPTDLLFISQQGKPLRWQRLRDGKFTNCNTIVARFDRLRKRTFDETQTKSFKHLRKTGATMITELSGLNDPLSIVQQYLGHSPGSIAYRHYVNWNSNNLDSALRRLESIIFAGKGKEK